MLQLLFLFRKFKQSKGKVELEGLKKESALDYTPKNSIIRKCWNAQFLKF